MTADLGATSPYLSASVREQLPAHRVCLQKVLSSVHARTVLTSLVLLNIGFVIRETDIEAAGHELPMWMRNLMLAFVVIFVLELVLRIYAQRWVFFAESLNITDAIVIIADSLAELVSIFGFSAPGMSVLRVFRLLKIARALRYLSSCREVYLMLNGFYTTMKSAFWAMIMILCVIVVWSVIAVHVLHPVNLEVAEMGSYADCERCPRAFASVFAATLTILQHLIAGDSWGTVSIPIIEHKPYTGIIFVLTIGSVQLGLLNLVIGIIVDSIEQSRSGDRKHLMMQKHEEANQTKKQLMSIYEDIDANQDGGLTFEELVEAYDSNEEFNTVLSLMDVGKEELHSLFNMMDRDRTGFVEYHEFVQQLHHLKAQDSHTMLIFIKHHVMEASTELSGKIEQMRQVLRLENEGIEQKLFALLDRFNGNASADAENKVLGAALKDAAAAVAVAVTAAAAAATPAQTCSYEVEEHGATAVDQWEFSLCRVPGSLGCITEVADVGDEAVHDAEGLKASPSIEVSNGLVAALPPYVRGPASKSGAVVLPPMTAASPQVGAPLGDVGDVDEGGGNGLGGVHIGSISSSHPLRLSAQEAEVWQRAPQHGHSSLANDDTVHPCSVTFSLQPYDDNQRRNLSSNGPLSLKM
eukprot:NODE_2345_length_2230_cov_13.292915.p1 GENE.NODE_2345_length_2230_cov_13.292915~~NODE_2345_length_2230_cov_13.292915.p1  ORF type:complete len:638 (-),score=170.78 NODE_2345_length_2230_cov_13.292915:233-2146(-)